MGAADEVHDFELTRMVAELREQRDLGKAHHAQYSKAAVEEDDLRWLLDKEDKGGSVTAAAAQEAQQELAGVAEHVTKQRIAFGTLKNQTLRDQHKLALLEEEHRLLVQEAQSSNIVSVL